MRKSHGGNYPKNWDEIAAQCKEAAGWKCVRCGHAHDPVNGYTLTVHHLDMNPANCAWWNLAALCQRCHLVIQAKVRMAQPYMFEHSEWFRPYVAGYNAHLWGLNTSREYVQANIDRLLDWTWYLSIHEGECG